MKKAHKIYAVVCILCVNNAYANDWQIDSNTQSARDNDRFSILNKELANEKILLEKAKSSKNDTETNLNIQRHQGNIDSLNKELGIKSANFKPNNSIKPLPDVVAKTPAMDIQPTLKINIPAPVKANYKSASKNNNLIKFRGKFISPALAQLYDSPLN